MNKNEGGIMNYKDLKFSDEVKILCSINERFDNEPDNVKILRLSYANIMAILCRMKKEAGRTEAGRNASIAITELENSCMRAIKGLYS